MNGMCVLTVKSAARGDQDQSTFVFDRRLSKHHLSQVNFTLLYVIDVLCGFFLGVYGTI